MNVRPFQTLSRYASPCIVSLLLGLMTMTNGVTADDYMTTCNYNDELCGWVDIETESKQEAPTTILEGSIVTIATAVGASTGVPFNAIVEPFAMAGPTIEKSLKMVRILDQWWESAVAYAEQMQSCGTDEAIDAIAALEPIDVEAYGPSILSFSDTPIEEADLLTTGIEVTPINNLIGSAPMIVTLDEPYMPYDLSADDLRLRSVFPLTTQPFCVRSRAARWNPVPMWTEFDVVTVATREKEPIPDPVDRWMVDSSIEQLIAVVDAWTDPQSTIRQRTSPAYVGQQWANIVARGNKVVTETTELIATYWPEPVAKPSASGKALLTRAGIEIGITPNDAPAEQIAELFSGPQIR
jgi:hypothetical protein